MELGREARWHGRVHYHGVLDREDYQRIVLGCDVALNCQRLSDPVSEVTYPSKTFTYLSAGLRSISSTQRAEFAKCWGKHVVGTTSRKALPP